jgi:hypothetical protein
MLANAEFCFRVEADGLPAETAQVAFRSDKAVGPEEKMRWRTLKGLRPSFTFDGIPLAANGAPDLHQTINPHTGTIETTWTQSGVGKVAIRVRGRGLHYTLEAEVTPEKAGVLAGTTETLIKTGVAPEGYCDFYLGFPGDKAEMKCSAGQPASLTLDGRFTHKLSPMTDPITPEIILDGPVEDQAAINSLAFQVTGYSGGLGPFGLTNDRYFGHVFWDADSWIFPALSLLAPSSAACISSYRLNTAPGAAQNFVAWMKAGRPIGNSLKMTKPDLGHRETPYKFAWESGASGRETATGDSRFEEHIGGTIVRSLEASSALGLADNAEVQKVAFGVTSYYLARMEHGRGAREMKAVMSPDEYHSGDNDLYTNMLARHLIRNHADRTVEIPIYLPKDAQGRFITYDGDEEKAYQQAAAVLTVFPLQDPEAESQALAMLDRFAPKVIEKGPAMSHSLHALIRARFGNPDEAYEEWRNAYDRYAKPPFGYISERPTTSQTIFVTGAAGFLNTVLYGFAGIRVDEKPWPDAQWKLPLKDGWWISGRANLPSKWKSLTIKDLKILGKSYTLTATQTGSTLTSN